MSRPLLQLALDHSSLEAAQRDVTLLKDSVDIVEAGTILCLNEGLGAVKALREQCPDKIIVADWKVADAGETLAVNHDQVPSHDIQDTGNHLAADNSARNLNFPVGIFQRIIIAVSDAFNDFYHKNLLNRI